MSAQSDSLFVVYNLKISNDKELFKENGPLKQAMQNAASNPNEILFNLELNSTCSRFSIDDNQNNMDDRNLKFSSSLAGYGGVIYFFKNDSILRQSGLLGDKFFISSKSNKDWQITNESKKIDNYTCYKATTIYKVDNAEKVFYHPVVAWFCPELPYSYGPKGYGNLPGLILELQIRNSNFGVKSISKTKKIDLKLKTLKNIKILTEEEFDKKLDEIDDFESKYQKQSKN